MFWKQDFHPLPTSGHLLSQDRSHVLTYWMDLNGSWWIRKTLCLYSETAADKCKSTTASICSLHDEYQVITCANQSKCSQFFHRKPSAPSTNMWQHELMPLPIWIRPDHMVEKLPSSQNSGRKKLHLTAVLLKRGMCFQMNRLLSLGRCNLCKRNNLLGPADAFNTVTNMKT